MEKRTQKFNPIEVLCDALQVLVGKRVKVPNGRYDPVTHTFKPAGFNKVSKISVVEDDDEFRIIKFLFSNKHEYWLDEGRMDVELEVEL